MLAEINQIYEQIKDLEGFPYNDIGSRWRVTGVGDTIATLRYNNLGLGLNKDELENHFKLIDEICEDDCDEEDDDCGCYECGYTDCVCYNDDDDDDGECECDLCDVSKYIDDEEN